MHCQRRIDKRLYNSPRYSGIFIGSYLWSIRGQTQNWRHHYKVFPIVFLKWYPGPRGFLLFLMASFATRTASYIFFIGTKLWEPRKESLWSRLLGTSLSCRQLLTVVSDWKTFLSVPWVIWLDGLNIFGDGTGVYMFTLMGMCGVLLLYQRILLPGKAKVFVVELAYNSIMML